MLVLIVVVAVLVFLVVVSSAGFVLTGHRFRLRRGAPPPLPEAPPAPPPRDATAVTEAPPAPPGAPPTPGAPPAPAPPERPKPAPPAVGTPETVAPETLVPETLVPETLVPETVAPETVAPELLAPERPRVRDRIGRARSLLAGYVTSVRSREKVDESTWEELEEALILADVGVEATTTMLDQLRRRAKAEKIDRPTELVEALKADLVSALRGDKELRLETGSTNVWLFVGVNGVGKTTTIGKLGLRERLEGRSVIMAAGDTFRAAAADQLEEWAKRVDADVVRGNEGGDPGAVIFDAVQRAAARGAELVLADTAGRLHTKVNLMEELKKVRRVAERPPGRVSEVLLVIDATTGQNGLVQAKQFAGAVGVTGVVLTKLDGTAKGGIAVAIRSELGLPIKLVGLGEGAGDLVEFDPEEFVEALIGS